MSQTSWIELGPVEQFTGRPLSTAMVGVVRVVVSWTDGQFGVLAARCNHAGGPLADGGLDGEYIVCPWHNWKYHCRSGAGIRIGRGATVRRDGVERTPLRFVGARDEAYACSPRTASPRAPRDPGAGADSCRGDFHLEYGCCPSALLRQRPTP
ncbi:MAG: Rieske (2Fe-2S) protein [Gemmatimonas sp.]